MPKVPESGIKLPSTAHINKLESQVAMIRTSIESGSTILPSYQTMELAGDLSDFLASTESLF